MMEGLLSTDKDIFSVHLSGGSPWGFTLHGGSEFNTKLYIKRITPGGKASNSRALQVGDKVLSINDVQCTTRSKAIEHVKRSGQNLHLSIRRENNISEHKANTRENGIKERSSDHYSPPNYYATALEVQENDFYSTYSVDPDMYAKIIQKTKEGKDKMAYSSDNDLSASNEDLLERYRKREPGGSEEELDNIEKPGFANGRISPSKDTCMSGQSLSESQLHGRTFTSPGRIQKVKIISTNISSSSSTFSSPDEERSRHQSKISPVQHSPIVKQYHLKETEATNDQDNWFVRWLRDDKSHSTPDKDISVKDACSKFEQERQQQQQPASPESPVQNRSNFSRSKSFSGRPSYGVVFGTTAVKSDDQHSEITAFQAPIPSTRYNSSNLLRDKARQNIPADSWKPVDLETSPRKATTMREDQRLEMRMTRKSLGAYPLVTSTSSLDSFSDLPRQGPAIPPRRSKSKLLSSMRRGKSSQTIGDTSRDANLQEESRPKHSVSNSWPSDHIGVTPVNNRQSWPPEDSASSSGSSKAAKRSTSVVIRSVKTSTSTDRKPKMYRSSSVEMKPEYEVTEAARPLSAQASRPQTRSSQQEETRKQHQQSQHKPLKQYEPEQKQSVPQQQQQQYLPQQQQQPHKPLKQYEPEQKQSVPQQQQQQQSLPQQRQPQQQSLEHQRLPQQQPSQHLKHYQRQQQQHTKQQQYAQHQPFYQQEQQPLEANKESLSSRIEDTQILQKLMQGNQVISPSRGSVISRIQRIEKSYSQPNLADGVGDPSFPQLSPGTHHHKQRSWDNSYSAFNRTFSNAKSELRATGRFGSSERLLDTSEHVEVMQNKANTVEEAISPVKVRSRELVETRKTVMQTATVQPSKEVRPVQEQILRADSASTQEKEVYLDEMFKTLQEKSSPEATTNTTKEPYGHLSTKTRDATPSVGDDDVFTNTTLDESLPPPPPTGIYQDTSHDNLPLPTPPREVLVGGSVGRTVPTRDRNRNVIHDSDYDRQQQTTNRHSFTENKSKREESKTLYHEADNDSDIKKNNERKQFEDADSITVRNSKNEELFNVKITDNFDNYIHTDLKSSPSPKERSFDSLTGPSKIELDTTETAVSKEPASPIVITSTPTRNDSNDEDSPQSDRGGNTSPLSTSTLSTPSSSRPGSMVSPKLEQLDKEKCELVDSMKKKIEDLRTQMNEISDEIAENEKLGEKVTALVENKASPSEFSKYQRFTGELNKIVLLLLSLTQRMHRYENTLQELDMSEEADRQQRDVLLEKIEHVKCQYEEACKIKEVNDSRGVVVSGFLENYFDEDEFADFQYYIDMKTQLALMHAEIKDKVKMGEERLNTLTATSIDWSTSSFSGY